MIILNFYLGINSEMRIIQIKTVASNHFNENDSAIIL